MEKFPRENQIEAVQLEVRKRSLKDAFEKGLEDPAIMAFHGTSLEAVQHLLEKGTLPGTTQKGGARLVSDTVEPVVSVYTLRSSTPRSEKLVDEEAFAEHLIDEASRYAGVIAGVHHFYRLLGLPLSKRYDLCYQYEDLFIPANNVPIFEEDRCKQFAKQVGKSVDDLRAAIRRSQKRKGIVIGFSEEIMNRFQTRETSLKENDEDHELLVRCPTGIPFDCVLGLDPQSKEEWKELEGLLL